MKKVVIGLVSALALTITTVGVADTANNTVASNNVYPYTNTAPDSGFYVSGNLGYGKVAKTESGFENKGFAWSGNIGYQFNKYFALEGGYTSLPDRKMTASSPNIYFMKDVNGIDLVAKGIYPINGQFSVFGKAGAMQVCYRDDNFDSTKTRRRVVPEFGVGAAYNVNKTVAVSLQGITTLAGKTTPHTYAGYLGVSYKFNNV